MAKKIERSPAAVAIAKAILEDGNIKSASDVNDVLREVCGTLFEALLQGEMDNHLGYDKSSQGDKPTTNRRNGYGTKTQNLGQPTYNCSSHADRLKNSDQIPTAPNVLSCRSETASWRRFRGHQTVHQNQEPAPKPDPCS